MMHKTLLALSLLAASTAAVSTSAMAQQRGGTPQEQAACSRDVSRFCRPVMNQGDMVVLSCLQQNRSRIGRACDQVLRSHGQ